MTHVQLGYKGRQNDRCRVRSAPDKRDLAWHEATSRSRLPGGDLTTRRNRTNAERSTAVRAERPFFELVQPTCAWGHRPAGGTYLARVVLRAARPSLPTLP